MPRMRLLDFILIWFAIMFGVEFGVLGGIYLLKKGLLESTLGYLGAVWLIVIIKCVFLFKLLPSLGMQPRHLISGALTLGGLLAGTAFVILITGVETLFTGTYTPQAVEEFRAFYQISGGILGSSILFVSQYIYYFIEILMVNLLYRGSLLFTGEREAIVMPALLWGIPHVLNIFRMSSLQALLLSIYMALFALFTYWLAWREESMKIPIYMWFLMLIL